MKPLVFILLSTFYLCSCDNTIEINKMIYINCDSTVNCRDFYVIKNPPENVDSLITLIKKYNDTTLSKNHGYVNYSRMFYKETSETARDYKPFALFFSMKDFDDIRDYNYDDNHEENFLIIYQHSDIKILPSHQKKMVVPYFIYKETPERERRFYYPALKKWSDKMLFEDIIR